MIEPIVKNQQNEHLYVILLAGGGGERLWPLSRRNKPKQLLTLDEQSTLVQQTVARIAPLVKREHIWIVTAACYEHDLRVLIGDDVGLFVVEPTARNTAAAVMLSCLMLQVLDPEATVLILPTDHYIPSVEKFNEFVSHAIDCAKTSEDIILFGVRPTYPATGYGYITYDKNKEAVPYPVSAFHEKPVEAVAQQLIDTGSSLWNIGIFCGRVSILVREAEKHAPDIFKAVSSYWLEGTAYDTIPSLSFDHAVIEKSTSLSVLPVDLVWCDVGNLTSFLSLQQRTRQNAPAVVAIDSQNNLIDVENKLVALIGIKDVCVVQVGAVLLIARRDETEKVKQVLEVLKYNKFDEYL